MLDLLISNWKKNARELSRFGKETLGKSKPLELATIPTSLIHHGFE